VYLISVARRDAYRVLSESPPPVSQTPRSIISAESSGGVARQDSFDPLTISGFRLGQRIANISVEVLGLSRRPATRSRHPSIVIFRPSGYADPILNS